MLATTAAWAFVLLDRTPSWHPWLRFAILLAGLASLTAILARKRVNRWLRPALATAAVLAALAGPAAYTLSTVATAETGTNPAAGPAIARTADFPGAGFVGRAQGAGRGAGRSPGALQQVSRRLTSLLDQGSSRYRWVAAAASAQTASSLELATGKSVMAIGGFSGSDPAITLARFQQLVAEGKIHYYVAGGQGSGPGGFGGPGGGFPGAGGPGGLRPPSGGGFPLGGGLGGPGGRAGLGGLGSGAGRSVQSQIESWVSSHFKSEKVGGVTVYDLTAAK
jgi:hypothetical protein